MCRCLVVVRALAFFAAADRMAAVPTDARIIQF
jgi:hypothetical protein